MVAPYAKAKLDNVHQQLSETFAMQASDAEQEQPHHRNDDDAVPRAWTVNSDAQVSEGRTVIDTILRLFRRLKYVLTIAFIRGYPYIHALCEALPIFYWWRFATKHTHFPSQWLQFAGCTIRHISVDDITSLSLHTNDSEASRSFDSMSFTEKATYIRQQSLKWLRYVFCLEELI